MSLAALAGRLADERRRLRELVAGDVEVRASLALSYLGLSPELACMFRRLGLVTRPDFAREMAAALADISAEEAEELLEALVDRHLLEIAPGPGRYRFHNLVRLYARERLQADETYLARDAARRRMVTRVRGFRTCPSRSQVRRRAGYARSPGSSSRSRTSARQADP